MVTRYLHDDNINYFVISLSTDDEIKLKRLLQEFCGYLDKGFLIRNINLKESIEKHLVNILSRWDHNKKILRWILNCLSHVASNYCLNSVNLCLDANIDYPDVIVSAITVIVKISRDKTTIDKLQKNLSRELIYLATLSKLDRRLSPFKEITINIDNASPSVLKSSLILIGKDKAPENLFHPKYGNEYILKELGGHDDTIVSQYSIWAACENKKFGINEIGIDVNDYEQKPPNIRAWIYRLIAKNPADAKKYFEILGQVRFDADVNSRYEGAIGLRDLYFDGINELTKDWYDIEKDIATKQALLLHFTTNSDRDAYYKEFALDEYKLLQKYERGRFLEAANGKEIYGKYKKIDFDEESNSLDLFGGGNSVTNINIQNSGSLNFATNGNATQEVNMHINGNEEAFAKLEQLKDLLNEGNFKEKYINDLDALKKDNNKLNAEKMISNLKEAAETGNKVIDFSKNAAPLFAYIPQLVQYLSHFIS